jgi:hypothetical protein
MIFIGECGDEARAARVQVSKFPVFQRFKVSEIQWYRVLRGSSDNFGKKIARCGGR